MQRKNPRHYRTTTCSRRQHNQCIQANPTTLHHVQLTCFQIAREGRSAAGGKCINFQCSKLVLQLVPVAASMICSTWLVPPHGYILQIGGSIVSLGGLNACADCNGCHRGKLNVQSQMVCICTDGHHWQRYRHILTAPRCPGPGPHHHHRLRLRHRR